MNFLLEPGYAIYTAMAAALVVWIGIFAFLWRLDRQAAELRRKIDQAPSVEQVAPRATLEARNPRPTADDRNERAEAGEPRPASSLKPLASHEEQI